MFKNQNIDRIDKWALVASIVLLIPALLLNIGSQIFIDDEAIRAIVAMEMNFTGDYISPRIFNELYLNKPPLYNWILLLSYKLFGVINETTSRIPTVIFLLLYAGSVYYLYKDEIGKKHALLLALLTITTGRIFFYDSFLGLIDICFSMLMFSLMLSCYKYAKKELWLKMYLLIYFLAAIGFLLKTLPALLFLGISILVVLFVRRALPKLFHPGHFLAFGMFLLIVGAYYILYHQANGLEDLVQRIFSESSKRTIVENSFLQTIKHFFTFPFDLLFHFAPWSILVVYLFKKGIARRIWNNEFLKVNLLLLVSNIFVYWISPEVYARYFLMFPALFLVIPLAFHQENMEAKTWNFRFVQIGIIIIFLLSLGSSVYSIFESQLQFINNVQLKMSLLALVVLITGYFILKTRLERLTLCLLLVVLFRLGFDIVVLPFREMNGSGVAIKEAAYKVADISKSEPLYLENSAILERSLGFYIMQKRNLPLVPIDQKIEESSYYIIAGDTLETCKVLYKFDGRHVDYSYFLNYCPLSKEE